jgi:predicted amidohydrolase
VRSLENQCYLASANAAGFNRGVRFVGHSMIVDPWGEVVAAAQDEETILRVEIEMANVRSAREQFPALSSRVDWLYPSAAG